MENTLRETDIFNIISQLKFIKSKLSYSFTPVALTVVPITGVFKLSAAAPEHRSFAGGVCWPPARAAKPVHTANAASAHTRVLSCIVIHPS